MLRFIPKIVKSSRLPSKSRLFRSSLIAHLHSDGKNPILVETYDNLKVISSQEFGEVGLMQGFWYPETDLTKTGAIRLASNNPTDTLSLLKDRFLIIESSKYPDVDASAKQLRTIIKKDIPHTVQKKNQLKQIENELLNRLLIRYDLSGKNLSFKAVGEADLANTIDPFIRSTVDFATRNQIVIQSVAIGYLHFIGLQNARKLEKEGVLIKVLNKRIYPLYSVFRPPMYQEYLDFFASFFIRHKLFNVQTGRVLEIGSGTGVLSLIMSQYVLKNCPSIRESWKVVATDLNPQAVLCTELNAKAVLEEHSNMIQPIQADLFPNGDEKFELIVSNPPFKAVHEIRTPFELSVYDKDERFLKTLLQNVADRLLDDGKLVLLYSNISKPVDYIDTLCSQNNLKVKTKEELDVLEKRNSSDFFVGGTKVQGTKERLQLFVITKK